MPQEDNYNLESSKSKEEYGNDYWQRWLKAAKKAAKCHWDDAKAAWDEYENSQKINNAGEYIEKRVKMYPAYFTAVKTIEPAYYSRTPKIVVTRDFDIDDEVANIGSLILQRTAKHILEVFPGFDEVMQYAVIEFINSDKATNQIFYDYKETIVDDGDGTETVIHTEQIVRAGPVSFDEILHTPEAKTWNEIRDIAYKFRMSKSEAISRFGEDKLEGVSWKVIGARNDEDRYFKDAGFGPAAYIEGWEIWCKSSKRVYWVIEDHPFILDIKEDPYGLKGFFPSPPFVISNRPRKHLYPTPIFVHLEPTLIQMHRCYRRIFDLIEKIKRRALVDGASPDLIAALNAAEGREFIAVQDIQSIVQRAEVGGLIWYVPVKELVDSISELNSLLEKFDDLFYRWIGVPDILRGETDPIETKGAQQLKTNIAHDRFKFQKKQIARLARDTIEMMVDLALKVFSPERIAQIAGIDYLTPEQRQIFPAALEMVLNDQQRILRLDIETDSLTFLDEEFELQRRAYIVQMVVEGLQRIGMIENPEFIDVALRMLLYSLSGLHGSREFEDSVKKAVKELVQRKAERLNEPPPLDPDMLKIQIQQQKVELQNQIEQAKLELEAQKNYIDSVLKSRELDSKEFKIASDAQNKEIENQIDMFRAQLDQAFINIESQRLEIERFRSEIQAQEAMLEEIRLAKEVDVKKLEAVLNVAQNKVPEPQIIQVPATEMPPINIKLDVARPGKKVGRVIRDPFGNATLEIEENP